MITIQALVLLRPAAACGRAAPSLLRAFAAAAAEGPKTATPPPDASRGATADLADVFIPGASAAGAEAISSGRAGCSLRGRHLCPVPCTVVIGPPGKGHLHQQHCFGGQQLYTGAGAALQLLRVADCAPDTADTSLWRWLQFGSRSQNT